MHNAIFWDHEWNDPSTRYYSPLVMGLDTDERCPEYIIQAIPKISKIIKKSIRKINVRSRPRKHQQTIVVKLKVGVWEWENVHPKIIAIISTVLGWEKDVQITQWHWEPG